MWAVTEPSTQPASTEPVGLLRPTAADPPRWAGAVSMSEPDCADPDQISDAGSDEIVHAGPRSAWGHRRSLGQRIAARVPMRLDPGRPTAVAIGLAVVVAAIATGAWLMAARPRALAMSSAVSGPASGAPSPVSAGAPSILRSAPLTSTGVSPVSAASSGTPLATGSGSGPPLVVDVAGKVHRPGVYRLPPGARVDDALTAAGGALRGVDLSSLNLAARVVDGQQIAVGVTGAGAAGGGPGSGSAGGAPGAGATAATGAGAGGTGAPAGAARVDLNTASLEQLESLPGVGPVLGQRILDWRSQHGRFDTVDQLRDVSGIGDVTFAALRARVTT